MSFSSSTRTPATGNRGAGRTPAGGPTRLPGSRERRPALAALAVILILLGAAGSALIALRSGDRQDFVAVSRNIPPGTKIEKKDLARGDLAGATQGLVLWSKSGELVGQYTTGWLYEGQFVHDKSFVRPENSIPADGALVGVSLEGGRAPSDPINPGDIVRVVRVPTANQDSVPPAVLVTAAEVTASTGAVIDSKTQANSTLNVTVLVPTNKATVVAAAAAAKTLVLVKLSPATNPEVARDTGGN